MNDDFTRSDDPDARDLELARLLSEPLTPVDEFTRRRMIGLALDEFDRTTSETRRSRAAHRWRPALAVAALLLVTAVGSVIAFGGGRPTTGHDAATTAPRIRSIPPLSTGTAAGSADASPSANEAQKSTEVNGAAGPSANAETASTDLPTSTAAYSVAPVDAGFMRPSSPFDFRWIRCATDPRPVVICFRDP